MSKLSDSINTSINSFKQRERFDDSKDIKKDRGLCIVKKQIKVTKTNWTLEELIGSLEQ